jgi:hypothetical protein
MLLVMLAQMLRFETVQQSDAVCEHCPMPQQNATDGVGVLL